MKMLAIALGVVILALIGVLAFYNPTPPTEINSFEGCVAAGNPVMESYPEQCRTQDGKHFVRNIGNELEKVDLIHIATPRPGDVIRSPLIVSGEARGFWFFEADFPVVLTDWDGRILAEVPATAQTNWMTEEFVPYETRVEFESPYTEGDPDFMKRGTLILRRDNASGLPEHDDALEIPVRFAK